MEKLTRRTFLKLVFCSAVAAVLDLPNDPIPDNSHLAPFDGDFVEIPVAPVEEKMSTETFFKTLHSSPVEFANYSRRRSRIDDNGVHWFEHTFIYEPDPMIFGVYPDHCLLPRGRNESRHLDTNRLADVEA